MQSWPCGAGDVCISKERSQREGCEFGVLEKGLGWRFEKEIGCYWQMDGVRSCESE